MTSTKARAYWQLMRMDKPIGSLLLLWPTLWALIVAAEGIPDLLVLVVFTLGVVMMRSAGCMINDFADRKIDGHVERTKGRPLPSGQVSSKEAIGLFYFGSRVIYSGFDHEYADDSAFICRCVFSVYLSLHEALHTPSATVSWFGVQLVNSNGVCRSS